MFGKCFGKSKHKNDVYNETVEDINSSVNTDGNPSLFIGSPSMNNLKQYCNCEESKLSQRNKNRISELQHQNTNLNKRLKMIERLLEM